jgi:isopentenyl-diphosphate delta-isomerase
MTEANGEGEQELVVLVDDDDHVIGMAPKLDVHQSGALHRAFSTVVWDSAKRLLLQKRQARKYHSGRLWTNACCGHPRPGEDVADAARRRLGEEMGFTRPLTTFLDVGLDGRVLLDDEAVAVAR